MYIYKLTWQKIDWTAYNTIGYNYTLDRGEIYAISETIAREYCPIDEVDGFIMVKKISVLTN